MNRTGKEKAGAKPKNARSEEWAAIADPSGPSRPNHSREPTSPRFPRSLWNRASWLERRSGGVARFAVVPGMYRERTRRATRPGKDYKTDETGKANRDPGRHCTASATAGWEPGCQCGADPIPCLAIDPFADDSTVGVVCKQLGRDFHGCELNSVLPADACLGA
jgi:hypothetical protein